MQTIMAKGQGKKGLIVTIIVLGLTLLAVGTVVMLQNINSQPEADSSTTTPTTTDNDKPADTTPTETPNDEPTTPAVDPATLNSIDIEPLSITVFYTKGIGGFEFAVHRTTDGTQYVEFSAPELVGTKCTGDTGAFASIIKSPASPEDKTTISQTVVVDGVTYGLSLAGKNCTADVALLEKYQTGFTNGFSQLKVMP
jgi:hypothetical protein